MGLSFPPHNGSRTSYAAAVSVQGATPRLRGIVLARIKAAGGLTCDEVEAEAQMSHQTTSARIRELALAGAIVDSGERRKTRSGRAACVWVVP